MDKKQDPKKWVIMLYLAADNNLSEEGVWSLTEIQEVVQQGNLKSDTGIVVLFDTNVRGRKTQIFEFGFMPLPENSNKTGGKLGAGTDVREWLNDADSTLNLEDANSPDLLTAFIKHTFEIYQADHHVLILSGHGSGAVGDFLKQGEDNVTGSDYQGMSIPTLGEAISEAGITIDILGMDSCLMSMAEVCFELPSQVQLLVGSEGNGPLTGWPYKEFLLELKKLDDSAPKDKPDPSPREIARLLQNKYIDYYADYYVAGTSVDMSVCDLSDKKKIALRTKVKELTKALRKEIKNDPIVRDKVILAHWRAQSYMNEQYTDLWDFCDLLGLDLNDNHIQKLCNEVKAAINSMVIESRYYGVRFQHSNGLSVYFPWKHSKELDAYVGFQSLFTGLKFASESGWGNFLKDYTYITRREMRGGKLEEDKYGFVSQPSGEIEVVTSSGNTVMFNDKDFPPDTKDFPPDTKDFPPDTKDFPPDTKGVLARAASMKNPPIGFLRDKETGVEITYAAKKHS